MSLPQSLARRLSLPLIAAPMFTVSDPRLVIAACRAGVIGAFPTANCRTPEELDGWLARLRAELGPDDAPFCANLVIRRPDLREHLERLCAHRVEMVITSVGSPAAVVGPLHEAGALVFADVASLAHAHKAIAAGVDGLVLLTAGAGGQTGSLNGFAFARAVRGFFQGPLVLAGGLADGVALRAAVALGCDLGYMGTRFIATEESRAPDAYKRMLVESGLDDVLLTAAFTGLPTSMLRPSLVAAGLDPEAIPESLTRATSAQVLGGAVAAADAAPTPTRWRDLWSAGHSVSGVDAVLPVAHLVARIAAEFHGAGSAAQSAPTAPDA
jgi:nitronate monooxygenase